MAKTVAFLGLGNMGCPMAANLVNAGFKVRGFDLSADACKRAEEKGITQCVSPAEAAKDAHVICSAVPETVNAEEVYLGEQGALSTAMDGAVCFDFSTISVAGSQGIALKAKEKGVLFLDTPMSGSVPHAEAGKLAIMVGGDREALEQHRDVLETVGEEITYFGPNGSGLVMKLVTNLIFAVHLSAIAEGLTLGKKAGLDPEAMADFLKKSVIPKILDYKASPMVAKDYNPIATVNIMRKDLRTILAMAEDNKVPVPLCANAQQAYVGAAALGFEEKDLIAVLEYFEKGAGF
jgi:3-hydroxyisobutyrate dehydrogenase-like beta-hydroxyacid dehydrogenase